MGTYNTLTLDWYDDHSQKKCHLILQFKYAELWQYNYRIGDSLKWGNHQLNEGDMAAKEVLVEAIVENADDLNGISEEFEILIKNNVILEAHPLINKRKYFEADCHYIILKK